MARPSRQSYEKARREQQKREKRERKAEKKAAVAAARAAGKDPYAPDEAVDPSGGGDEADGGTFDDPGAPERPATD